MQIGSLAKQSGFTVQTIRFYERRGLLPEPLRRASGYRSYSDRDLHRLDFIRQSKSLGFSLAEIRQILQTREQGVCPCRDVVRMGHEHLMQTERQIRRLARFRKELARAMRQWKRCGRKNISASTFCGLIERTMEVRSVKGQGSRIKASLDSIPK